MRDAESDRSLQIDYMKDGSRSNATVRLVESYRTTAEADVAGNSTVTTRAIGTRCWYRTDKDAAISMTSPKKGSKVWVCERPLVATKQPIGSVTNRFFLS